MLNREPLKIVTQNKKFTLEEINRIKQKVSKKLNISIVSEMVMMIMIQIWNDAMYRLIHVNVS